MSSAPAGQHSGFTLLEVMVSLTVVALCVTVYFQLFSSGMKLEYRSQQRVQNVLRAQKVFAELQTRDAREDDFEWQGQDGQSSWELKIEPMDVQTLEFEEGPVIQKQTELYMYVFRYVFDENKTFELNRLVAVEPGFFSDDFKSDHLE